ncbi:prepilin peptidase [Saccharomonospora piscinae]|uniref:Prepilin peptidase n=1 Tax=Saccharomonospora piscinae TaxID=687388 RepID=A0A1V9ACU4_SACPI|nr:A24 family peptidase [Saccharomonospora piscinae]OQO94901.1 prepilin peptidase [Saccharomonospora piscinae]
MHWVIVTLPLAVIGLVVGWAASRALSRARRPAPVPVWCGPATGALWGATGLLAAQGVLPGWWLPVPLAAAAFAVPLAVADLRYRRLPDVLTLPAYAVALAAVGSAAASGPGPPLALAALVGGAVTLACHGAVHALAPGSLGPGDVKLSGSLGVLSTAAGWPTLVVSLVLASLFTAVLGAAAALAGTRRWRDGVPHGPGLLAATVLGVSLPGEVVRVGS